VARVKAKLKSVASRLKRAAAKLVKDTRSSGAKRRGKVSAKAPARKKPVRLGHRPAAPKPTSGKLRAVRKAGPLAEGSVAPSFSLLDDQGQLFSSHVLEGEPYIVYFYPRDDTPGCTKEACSFRDHLPELWREGVRVIGISRDPPGSHARFRDKYDLPFTLLSDEAATVAKAFGIWVKKQQYGREYFGVERSTFLIDEGGRIERIWRNVKVAGHVEAVVAAVKAR
jgi:thioredoxin-dependent peroxiredoxin